MSAQASFMAAWASSPEVMQHTDLNCIDYATLLAPILFEMHRNPPIKKSKFVLDKTFTKAELTLPRLHAHCPTISCSPLLTQTAQKRHITTWAQQTSICWGIKHSSSCNLLPIAALNYILTFLSTTKQAISNRNTHPVCKYNTSNEN